MEAALAEPRCFPLKKKIAPPHPTQKPPFFLGMCANKIIRTYDLIGDLIGKRMILLGGTRGGP